MDFDRVRVSGRGGRHRCISCRNGYWNCLTFVDGEIDRSICGCWWGAHGCSGELNPEAAVKGKDIVPHDDVEGGKYDESRPQRHNIWTHHPNGMVVQGQQRRLVATFGHCTMPK